MIVRLCKTALVASVAAFFTLVGIDNMLDYGANYAFVRHVLAMDSVFPDSTMRWRALTQPEVATAAYALIIAWQIATALVLIYGTIRLATAARRREAFIAAKGPAVLGLTMGLLLYGLGFTVVGGEWFDMWQSKTWNGLESAARFLLFAGTSLVVLLLPEA